MDITCPGYFYYIFVSKSLPCLLQLCDYLYIGSAHTSLVASDLAIRLDFAQQEIASCVTDKTSPSTTCSNLIRDTTTTVTGYAAHVTRLTDLTLVDR